MGYPGLDPSTALQLLQTLLYGLAWLLGGLALLGLSAYVVFLSLGIFSPQPSAKARTAEVPQEVGGAPVSEESLRLVVAETPIPAEAERLGEDAVRVPALPPDSQMPMTLLHITLESEPTWRWGFLNFLRSRRAVVRPKRRSGLKAEDQLQKLA